MCLEVRTLTLKMAMAQMTNGTGPVVYIGGHKAS